jgi:hypothetical protein
VTFTSKATLSPQSVNEPFSGVMISTIGAVLPTVITTEVRLTRPPLSVTRTRAVYWPSSV